MLATSLEVLELSFGDVMHLNLNPIAELIKLTELSIETVGEKKFTFDLVKIVDRSGKLNKA